MAEKVIRSISADRSQIEEIKSRISIEDVISRYVRLKPSGKNLFGLCPFHKEDTPSFSVNPELQRFKCFGCGEGGDVFTFLEKIENIEFNEVLEKLAQEAGIQLRYSQRDPKETQKYTLAKESHKMTNLVYRKILLEHPMGQKGRDYVKQRKFTKEAVEAFQIGYAPKSSNNSLLTNQLIKKNFTKTDLVNYGLSVERNGRTVDKFVDRLVFPILDNSGNTIAFSGRILEKDDKRPKYLNSPETILFQKRHNLFGFYQAKQDIRIKKVAIMVEGQTDVISSWQIGIKNIVAPLGTGVTSQQIQKIKKITPNLILAFDSDNAGLRAIMRTAIIALNEEMNVYTAKILYGKDADECIKNDPNLWKKSIEQRIPVVSFFIDIITQRYDPQSLTGKKVILDKIAPLIKAIKDKVTREHHIAEISSITNIDSDILRETFDSSFTRTKDTVDIYINPENRDIPKEIYLLTLSLQYTKELSEQIKKFDTNLIENTHIRALFDKLKKKIEEKSEIELSKELASLNDSHQNILRDSIMRPIWIEEPSRSELIKEFENTHKSIKKDSIKQEISKMKHKLTLSENQGDTKSSNEILNKINEKISQLEKISRS